MSFYQNGILISGVNTLPELTRAQYEALPAYKRPEYWVCLDEEYEPSSSGHTIEDTNATTMPQEENLQFVGIYTEDDATNDRTKVNIVREMTSAQMQSLTSAQKKGFIRTTDEPDNPYNNTGKHIRRTLTFTNGYSDINTNTDADIRGRATIGVFPTADENGLSYLLFPFNYGTGLLRIYGYQFPQNTAILDGTSIAVDIMVY